MLQIEGLHDRRVAEFNRLVLDFSGTLTLDGRLLPGVRPRLQAIARNLSVTVMTADTFGTAERELRRLPLQTEWVQNAKDKERWVQAAGAKCLIAIGNGRNDAGMLKRAGLGIAVIGPEGAAACLFPVADVIVRDIRDALDLLLHPLRLKATLRL